jgi:hypothetical protein
MSVVTWGLLTKSAEDATKIEEEIDARIASHNADPDSHGLSGMSLYAHRTGDVLDHLDEAVSNIKIKSGARAYTAIVDPSGEYDYTNIQSAIDYVNSKGGGVVFIRSGTYVLATDLILYDNVALIGLKTSECIIDFNNNGKGFRAWGETTPYTTGTISITGNTKIVTGSGTLWLGNVAAGDWITIKDVLYKIASVDSNTQLTLEHIYYGPTVSNSTYKIATYLENIILKDIWITKGGLSGGDNPSYGAVDFQYVKDSIIEGVKIDYSLFYGLYISNIYKCTISGNDISNNYRGIQGDNVNKCIIQDNFCDSNQSDGLVLPGTSSYNLILGNSLCHNGGSGLTFVGLYNTIMGNKCNRNDGTGIAVGGWPVASYNSIIGNICNENFYDGIGIFNEKNIIEGNICRSNGRDGIRAYLSYNASYNSIKDNICSGNTGYGVNIYQVECIKNIVVGNQLLGNTAGSLNNSGANTEIGHNIDT